MPSDLASFIDGNPVEHASAHNLIGDPDSSGGLIDGTNGNIVGDGGSLLPASDVIDLATGDRL